MFSYYGSKSKVVNYYPPPKYGKIIEPFAGSARYSLKYFDRDITLVDKNKSVIDAWSYLKNATVNDITELPKLKPGDNIDNFNLSCGEKSLLSFLVNVGNTGRKSMTERSFNQFDIQMKNIKSQLFKIKHWVILLGSYDDLPNDEQTWFIDPPYQFGGNEYKESNKQLNFVDLAEWCKSRNGQIIVCENTKANWLPFLPMIDMMGSVHKTTEAIWSNILTNYEFVQQKLF
jgi:site-specific DNA-adenine methylase